MRCANATTMDRSRRDESSATSIVQIGRGVTEQWPFKVSPQSACSPNGSTGEKYAKKQAFGQCARSRQTGRLRGILQAVYLRGPASDQRDRGTAVMVSTPASRCGYSGRADTLGRAAARPGARTRHRPVGNSAVPAPRDSMRVALDRCGQYPCDGIAFDSLPCVGAEPGFEPRRRGLSPRAEEP